jgi:hypothetical protein
VDRSDISTPFDTTSMFGSDDDDDDETGAL